eukprot:2066083-Pleurochrysis_carterae.AAC.1
MGRLAPEPPTAAQSVQAQVPSATGGGVFCSTAPPVCDEDLDQRVQDDSDGDDASEQRYIWIRAKSSTTFHERAWPLGEMLSACAQTGTLADLEATLAAAFQDAIHDGYLRSMSE